MNKLFIKEFKNDNSGYVTHDIPLKMMAFKF